MYYVPLQKDFAPIKEINIKGKRFTVYQRVAYGIDEKRKNSSRNAGYTAI